MKKYLVIGKPINHSLSPKLHNYWFKLNNINATYEKKQIDEKDIEKTILDLKNNIIDGINVTVPFKKSVIPFMDELSEVAKLTQSVNTIHKKGEKIIGENTDVGGFENAIKNLNYNIKGKTVFIIGAGGVVSSIIIALKKMGAAEIILTNRTYEKALNLKKAYPYLNILKWGKSTNFDIIINATTLGLKKSDEIKLNFENSVSTKLFYDVIYNPSNTRFLSKAKDTGNRAENGKTMFIYQAQLAFEIWHKIKPIIDEKVFKILGDD